MFFLKKGFLREGKCMHRKRFNKCKNTPRNYKVENQSDYNRRTIKQGKCTTTKKSPYLFVQEKNVSSVNKP